MADDADDGYQAYYSGKLWSLLPQIYRTSDPTGTLNPNAQSTTNGPLRELVNRIGAQAATLRRSIDRMWEDQSIETCDDWVIPYIGAQLAVNLVTGLDARSQRLAVFRAIYYGQRKGTIPILEQIAVDTTGWAVRVVELYRRLGRARHGLDPELDWPIEQNALVAGLIGAHTRTLAGGFADLRNDYGASRAGTAFDEFFYTADVRSGQGRTGWYNIPQLGVFLWRLQSVPIEGVTAVAASGTGNQYTFDPTGRDVQLFASPVTLANTSWVPRQEWQLPAPIDRRLLRLDLSKLYATTDATKQHLITNAFGLYAGAPGVAALVSLDRVSAELRDTTHYVIDPTRGRITAPAGATKPLAPLLVSYCYGFSSTIGAGGYDRRPARQTPIPVSPLLPIVTGGGGNIIATSGGTVEIGDSLTYDRAPNYTINASAGPNALTLQASNLQRPLVRFAAAAQNPTQWTFAGSVANGAGSTLRLDGLFISGGDVVLTGCFDKVVLSTCTLDPGAWACNTAQLSIDGRPLIPTRLSISGTVRCLEIDRCILGPISVAGKAAVQQTRISDSIVQVVTPGDAITIPTGATTVCGCSVLGQASFYQLEATDSLFCDVVKVANYQEGCVRFSAWTRGSILPSQYQCVQIEPRQPLFASTAFGRPDYGQLLSSVDRAVGAGAENGSEMGAFSRDNNPIKQQSLLIRYQDYLPIGVTPVLVYMT
jgi:hypothetical protein